MRALLRLFYILFAFAFLISCDSLDDLFGKFDRCDIDGRQLTEQELSILNFNAGDSTTLTDDENNAVYLKCISKEYENVFFTPSDPGCKNATSGYYQISANYETNILNEDSSFLDLAISIHTAPRFAEGNDPLPQGSFSIDYFSLKGGWNFLRCSSEPNSNKLVKSPLECPFEYSTAPCTPRFFISYLSDTTINNQNFNSVCVLSSPNGGKPTDTGHIEKVYYHNDYGIIRLVYRGVSYNFEKIFR